MAPSARILWLTPPFTTDRSLTAMRKYMHTAGIPWSAVRKATVTTNMWVKRTAKTWHADPDQAETFWKRVLQCQPTHILINDRAALSYITGGRYDSLAKCRGSVYQVSLPGTNRVIPALCIDALKSIHTVKHARFALLFDLAKLRRLTGNALRPEPEFSFCVCTKLRHLQDLVDDANQAILIGMDVETSGIGARACITCDGYALLMPDNTIRCYVVPFANPTKPGGRHWDEHDEPGVHTLLSHINSLPTPKVLQNGSYDSHYYLRYRRPPRNFIWDTAVMWHSIWAEAPKRIDFIASIAVDGYTFWKDEHGEDEKDDLKGKVSVPQTAEGLHNYWRYNALDTYYTVLCFRWLIERMAKPKMAWACANYATDISATIGPAFAMATNGVRVNPTIHHWLTNDLQRQANQGLANIRLIANDPQFNPNSADQVCQLVYDIWGGKGLTRGKYKGRSASEIPLKVIQTQSPLLDRIIQAIWDAKKPANNLSKYGNRSSSYDSKGLTLWQNRWYYTQNPTGTETGRYSSSQSNWWVGTQIQNPPYAIRNIVDADPGYWLFNADYAQSDNYYTAFQAEDERMIRAVLSEQDTHCLHAAQFFKRPYEEIYQGYKAKEPWVVDATKGVRQNTKRVVYGNNYLMAGMTMFLTMGKRAVVASAEALGHTDAPLWSLDRCVRFCDELIDFYFREMYPDMKPWLAKDAERVAHSGMTTCAFGRTRVFFDDVADRKGGGQRELAAFYGQGGTAGCMNLALERIYYQSDFYAQGGRLLLQMHDSICGQIPVGRFDLLDIVLDCMRNPCTLHGRQFTVPVDAEIGLGWGERMCAYTPGKTTSGDIFEANQRWLTKNGLGHPGQSDTENAA